MQTTKNRNTQKLPTNQQFYLFIYLLLKYFCDMASLAHGSSGRPHIFLYTYLRGVSLSLGALFFNIKFIIVVVHAIV